MTLEHNDQPPELEVDTGLQCLVTVANFLGVSADPEQIRHSLAIGSIGMRDDDILRAAKELGLKSKLAKVKCSRLAKLKLPAIAKLNSGNYLIIAKVEGEQLLIFDPVEKRPTKLGMTIFNEQWGGELFLFSQRGLREQDIPFGFKWFIPSILKHKWIFGEILIAAFILQLFGLVTPLITQVVIDKVLVHQGVTTLDVLTFGLLAIGIFELVLSMVRTYIFTHTTNRIDVILGAKLFSHLFKLPLAYFESRRIGDTVARVRELENIRHFMTGSPLTSVLDVLFITVYISVMFFYSTTLTYIVLCTLPLYIILSAFVTPLLRHRLEEKFQRGAESQSFLVEAVSGVQTVKSYALEPQMQKRWEGLLSNYVQASFKTTILSGNAGAVAQFIQRISTLGILWFGAHLIMQNHLSVGQLIAFQMMAGRVSDPVLRLVSMWQEFQQMAISVRKLSDIFHTKPEPAMDPSKSRLPAIRGQIKFEQVKFRYRIDGPEILRNMSFAIQPGTIVGVVGRSGSGKSTLSKLIQRLYVPESGKVLVDGIDIAMSDPSWLRRQIGVVLQENYLFNMTVRENIAIHYPSANINDIVQVAQLAGAHEFILELPDGYDTIVGEKGTSLSGGQRQRIAIARALLLNPRVLIFDEATSALDYESEKIIQQNLQKICRGRTVFIIAHRLSTLSFAHKIMVIDRGVLVEQGNHQELMRRKGLYHYLYSQQESEVQPYVSETR